MRWLVLFALLLTGCAAHHRPACTVTECGDLCCNDDGKVCPACLTESYATSSQRP